MSTLFATRGAEPGDVALLGDATGGDLDAFATLYRRHQQRITGQPLSDDQVVAQLQALLAYWERRDLGR